MSKPWTVQSCFDCAGRNTHIASGDQLTLTESGEPHLVITREGETCLDVRIKTFVEPLAFSFERGSSRGSDRKSDRYRGHLTVRPNGRECDEVLTLILGHKCPANPECPGHSDGDDDDTEVVVATRPATK